MSAIVDTPVPQSLVQTTGEQQYMSELLALQSRGVLKFEQMDALTTPEMVRTPSSIGL